MDVRFVDAAGAHPHDSDDVVDLLERDDGFMWVDVPLWDDAGRRLPPGPRLPPAGHRGLPAPQPRADRAQLRRPLLRDLHSPLLGAGRARPPARARPGRGHQLPGHRARPAQPGRRPRRGARGDHARVLRRIESGRFVPATPAELSYAVTSAVARRQRALVGDVAEQLPGLEQHVMASQLKDPEALLERMFLIRHELITARTMAAQSHDVHARIGSLDRFVPEPRPAARAATWPTQFDRVRSRRRRRGAVPVRRDRALPDQGQHQDDAGHGAAGGDRRGDAAGAPPSRRSTG